MKSSGDRDKKGTAQGQESSSTRPTLCIGIAGELVNVDADDEAVLLADDPSGEARYALDRLCEAKCDRLILLYILKVMRDCLPCPWWEAGESKEEAQRRRDDADIADRFVAIVKEQFAFVLPQGNMTPQDEKNLRGWDEWSIRHEGFSVLHLLRGAESIAAGLRCPDEFRQAAGLRSNQNDFDMISRAVLCAYVHRSTGDWHDQEVAVLLTQVGNYKSDRRKAILDAEGVRKWRGTNQDRLRTLSQRALDQLVGVAR